MEGLAELHTHLGGSVSSDILWTLAPELNAIIVEKAIKWAPRGIVGVDVAGPRPGHVRYDYTQLRPTVDEARAAGLGVTIHVGEEGGETGRDEIGEVVAERRPDRIGP